MFLPRIAWNIKISPQSEPVRTKEVRALFSWHLSRHVRKIVFSSPPPPILIVIGEVFFGLPSRSAIHHQSEQAGKFHVDGDCDQKRNERIENFEQICDGSTRYHFVIHYNAAFDVCVWEDRWKLKIFPFLLSRWFVGSKTFSHRAGTDYWYILSWMTLLIMNVRILANAEGPKKPRWWWRIYQHDCASRNREF